jgi:hypothetical protein
VDRTPLSVPGPAEALRIPSGGFGRLSFGFLAVAILSGASLAPFWSSTAPLESLERLEGGLPWGFLLRAIHVFSSYGLLVATTAHLVQVVAKRTERQLRPAVWWRSVLLLPLAAGALLGGFVLRGDAEAAAALAVWRQILDSAPLVGAELSRLLLGTVPADLGAVALHHAGTFTLLLWLFTSEHGGRFLPDARGTVLAGLVSVALAAAVPLPLGVFPGGSAPGAPAHLLLGPWYLLGLQGALVDLPVAAGWLGPLVPVLLLGLVRHSTERTRTALLALLVAWAAAYGAFTVRILLLSRG